MATILVVDDYAESRELLCTLLGYNGHEVLVASDGTQALQTARLCRPDLIVTDILMPGMDGYELVRCLRADPTMPWTRVIFCSATYYDDEARALATACGVRHFIRKPAETEEILSTVREALQETYEWAKGPPGTFETEHHRLVNAMLLAKVRDLEREVQARRGAEAEIRRLLDAREKAHFELEQAYDATIEGWARALDLRDKETEGHSRRVTDVTVRLAREMGLGEEELVHMRRGALLHDIGKMGVPDAILLKPGPLTEAEWQVMRAHPELACALLDPIEFLRPALDIPRYHHERWNGSGYPNGLKREGIPQAARIFAVVDVWDAMTSDRPYRKALPEPAVRDHLGGLAGTHFDPNCVKAFLGMMPPGVPAPAPSEQSERKRNG